jgi:hypothetical protein
MFTNPQGQEPDQRHPARAVGEDQLGAQRPGLGERGGGVPRLPGGQGQLAQVSTGGRSCIPLASTRFYNFFFSGDSLFLCCAYIVLYVSFHLP